MFRFEHVDFLYLLVIIPVLIVFFLLAQAWRKRLMQKMGEKNLIERLMIGWSKYKHPVKFSLFTIGLLFLIVGMANPQWGAKTVTAKAQGVDIFVALDLSQSMLAQDIAPNRIERAKNFVRTLVEARRTDRFGLIVFAGSAFLQMPLTSDELATIQNVRVADPRNIPAQGTAIGDALKLADESFPEDSKGSKVVILVTDGENHDEEAIAVAEEAKANGITLYTIGVGTEAGGFFPDINHPRGDYKRNRSGNPVRSRLNEDMIKNLAAAGGGEAYLLTDASRVADALNEQIDRLEKREYEEQTFTEYESHFQPFILLALIFLIVEFLISYRPSKWLKNKDIF